MNEMVERVAKAIWESQHGPWENLPTDGREAMRIEARAAIKAMRNPLPEMTKAGAEFVDRPDRHMKTLNAWQAMIDSALTQQD
jgi:hypothetical protein